jgi:dihydrofolate reductase
VTHDHGKQIAGERRRIHFRADACRSVVATTTRWLLRSLNGDAPMLGSSELVASLAQAGALDEFRLMVTPVAIGSGSAALNTLTRRLPLALRGPVRFGSGNVLLTYGTVS